MSVSASSTPAALPTAVTTGGTVAAANGTAAATATDATTAAATAASGTSSTSHYVRNEAIISAGKKLLDMVRAGVKIPEAARNGHLGAALLQTATGTPTTNLIDPDAPPVATAASAGKSFTAFDKGAYRLAAGIDVGIGVFRLANGVPNMVNAVKQNGAAGIIDTREGRDGLLQTASGTLTLGLFGGAARAAKAAGVTGFVPVALAAATSDTLTAPWVIGTYVTATGLVIANDHGFLDFLNKGDTRSFGQVEKDAWDQLGVRQHIADLGNTAATSSSPPLIQKAGTVIRDWAEGSS